MTAPTDGGRARAASFAARAKVIGPVWALRLGPPLAYLMANFGMRWPLLTHLGERSAASSDGILISWYFEWIAQSFVHGHNPFVTTALNAPNGVNVMWNTAVFLLAVVCIPLTLTIGATATVALMVLIAPVASASVAYWVLRRLTGGSLGAAIGAAIGAAVYGFGPFDNGQFGHLHLLVAVFPPLLLLLGYRILITQRTSAIRAGVALGLATGLQMLVSEELVALCAVAGAVAVVWLVVLNPSETRARFRYAATSCAVGVGVAFAIMAVPLWFQFHGRDALSSFTASPERADLASLVRPSLLLYYSSRADRSANIHYGAANGAENTAYLGWPLIIATVAVAVWFILRRDRFAAWWLLTSASIAVLMLGSPISVNGHRVMRGPWGLLRRFPLLGGAIPVRLSLIMLLMVGGLIAWTLAKLRGRALVAGIVIAAAVLVPLRPAYNGDASRLPPTPRFFATSAVDAIPAGAITAVLPQAGFPQVAAMLWQIRAHMRFSLVGGYSVFDVRGHSTYFPRLPYFVTVLRAVGNTGVRNPTAEEDAAATVRASGVTVVVITAAEPHMYQVAAAAAAITGCEPRPVADVLLCQIPG